MGKLISNMFASASFFYINYYIFKNFDMSNLLQNIGSYFSDTGNVEQFCLCKILHNFLKARF